MIKFIVLTVAVLAAAYFGLGFAGYRLAPENLHYYAPETQGEGGVKNAALQYLDQVKFNNKNHPLIVRKKGVSGAESLDNSSTKVLRGLLQADKFDQMEKMKKQIKEISEKADSRNKIVEEAEKV